MDENKRSPASKNFFCRLSSEMLLVLNCCNLRYNRFYIEFSQKLRKKTLALKDDVFTFFFSLSPFFHPNFAKITQQCSVLLFLFLCFEHVSFRCVCMCVCIYNHQEYHIVYVMRKCTFLCIHEPASSKFSGILESNFTF